MKKNFWPYKPRFTSWNSFGKINFEILHILNFIPEKYVLTVINVSNINNINFQKLNTIRNYMFSENWKFTIFMRKKIKFWNSMQSTEAN